MTQRDQEHILKAAKESGHAASMMIHAVENTKGRTKQQKIITHSFIYSFTFTTFYLNLRLQYFYCSKELYYFYSFLKISSTTYLEIFIYSSVLEIY